MVGSTVVVLDMPAGKKEKEWQFPGPVHGLAFAPDSRHLAVANGNGTIYILRLSGEAQPRCAANGGIAPIFPPGLSLRCVLLQ